MKIKIKAIFPQKLLEKGNCEVNLKGNNGERDIVEYIEKNKEKLVKLCGCNLSPHEVKSAIATGEIILTWEEL